MKKKFIRLVLAKEDTDLIAWKNSLPPRSFTETVNKILVSESGGQIAPVLLVSESGGQIAPVLYEFSSSEVAEEVRAGFYVGDENVLALLNGINKGDRTDAIKEIIRKHIKHNCEHPPAVVSVELLHNILVDFRTKMVARETACAGVEDKYRKLCDSYYDGMVTLFNTVLAAAYNSGDEKDCDQGLRQLDVNQIVNQVFEGNFGPQRVPEEGE